MIYDMEYSITMEMSQYHTQVRQLRVLLQLNPQLSVTCPQTFQHLPVRQTEGLTPENSERNPWSFGYSAATVMAQTKLEDNQICCPNTWRLLNILLETPGKKKRMGSTDSEALRAHFFRVGRTVTDMLVTVSQESCCSSRGESQLPLLMPPNI